jgi:signal transduction histidine kinase
MRRSALELLDLVQSTLDLSRVESGRDDLRLGPVDVQGLLAELAADYAAIARAPDTRLAWHVEPGLVVECDGRKLRIVVKNLVGNALKFTPSGRVDVTAEAMDDARWRLVVQDTGVGIPADQVPTIFEMFGQGATGAATPGGVGLGLYLVRQLVEQLGGTVRCESAPGRGSTFVVELPRGAVAPPAAAHA